MATKTFTITVDTLLLLGIRASRLYGNKDLPAQIQDGVNEDGTPKMVPNPEVFTTDEAYVQQRLGVDAPTSWYNSTQQAFRIPTGEWLMRFTMAEKKGIRAIGAGKYPAIPAKTVAMVNAFLDRLDENAIIKLSDNDVEQGVPVVVGLLALVGVIPQATVAERTAAILALNI